jgi:hypothetical protein
LVVLSDVFKLVESVMLLAEFVPAFVHGKLAVAQVEVRLDLSLELYRPEEAIISELLDGALHLRFGVLY